MGARHHSTNERNGKWTMRRAYSDENRHCAMWLTCKGMSAQHETGISIQMFPRTWSPMIRRYEYTQRYIKPIEGRRNVSLSIKRDFYPTALSGMFHSQKTIFLTEIVYLVLIFFLFLFIRLLDIRYSWSSKYKMIDYL